METVGRVAFVYALIMVTLRIMGKRELGRLSPFELVLLMLIPELFQQALMREDFSMTNAVIAFFTLTGLVFLTSLLAHRFRALDRALSGTPTVIASGGRFLEAAMNEERVHPEEVYSELRKVGLERLADAKLIVLEEDGKLSIVPVGRRRTLPADEDREL